MRPLKGAQGVVPVPLIFAAQNRHRGQVARGALLKASGATSKKFLLMHVQGVAQHRETERIVPWVTRRFDPGPRPEMKAEVGEGRVAATHVPEPSDCDGPTLGSNGR